MTHIAFGFLYRWLSGQQGVIWSMLWIIFLGLTWCVSIVIRNDIFGLIYAARVLLDVSPGSGRPVLYLRSFDADGRSDHPIYDATSTEAIRRVDPNAATIEFAMRLLQGEEVEKLVPSLSGMTFEQQVRFATRNVGPMVSASNKHEILPGLGAERLPLGTEWQSAIRELIDQSRLIIVQAHRTPGLIWELGELRQRALPRNVLLLFPPLRGYDKGLYKDAMPAIAQALSVTLPSAKHIPIVIGFDDNWRAEIYQPAAMCLRRVLSLYMWSGIASALMRALRDRNLPTPRFALILDSIPPFLFAITLIVLWMTAFAPTAATLRN